MQMGTGDVKTMEELEKIYKTKAEIKLAGYEKLPDDITPEQVEELKRKPNRKERRKQLSVLRKMAKKRTT